MQPEKHHQMRGAVRADSGQSEQACRDLVVDMMVLIAASKTDGVRSIWVAREGWKKGIVNPIRVAREDFSYRATGILGTLAKDRASVHSPV